VQAFTKHPRGEVISYDAELARAGQGAQMPVRARRRALGSNPSGRAGALPSGYGSNGDLVAYMAVLLYKSAAGPGADAV